VKRHAISSERATRRRGVAAVFAMVMLVVLIGFAALTVDSGVLYNTRSDLQDAADAAARAGAWAFTDDRMVDVRASRASTESVSSMLGIVTSRAESEAVRNDLFARSATRIEHGDVQTGWLDVLSATSPLDTGAATATYNAVSVTMRCTSGSANGPVGLYFSSIFGRSQSNVTASATGVFDDRFSGYDVGEPGAADLWPFTIAESEYNRWLANGTDNYGYDTNSEAVTSGADGTREIQLYPDSLAPGNYGLLNIGTPNQSTPALEEQIENGVTVDDLEREIGTSQVTFLDSSGHAVTYHITGNPGLKAALEPSINLKVGDVVTYFLHNDVQEQGSNSVYRIVQMRFGRVMGVQLQGASSSRGLWVQPVSYAGPGVLVSPGAGSSGGVAGRVYLAR